MGSARCGHHGGPLSVGDDLAIARQALVDGDAKHAAFHAACALAVDARDGAALELADQILDAVPDPRALFEIEAGTYYGLVALACRARWQAGERAAAVEQLGGVIGYRPDVGYATWLLPWLGDGGAEAAAIAIQRAGEKLASADARARAEVLAVGAEARRLYPDAERVGCMHARNLRTCGEMAEALVLLEALDRAHRSYLTGVFLATTRKMADDRDGAIALLEDVCARFPDDDAVFLDLGDFRLEANAYAAAVAAYQHVVARDPHHDWAYPSLLYARYLAANDPSDRDRLEDAALVDGARRARQLAHAVTPYLGYLPSPPEAVLKVGEQIRRSDPPSSGKLAMALSSLEAPSAIASLARLVARTGGELALSTEVGSPDPRRPRGPVAIPTWRYDGTAAVPALDPPPPAIGAAIARIADQRFDGPGWLDDAAGVARELGPDAGRDVIAAMLHWPTEPSWASPLTWGYRFQVAGALVLANLDDGWEGSRRASALRSLIEGPPDWLAVAGLVAVTRLCDREPALVPVATRLLDAAVAVEPSPIHHMCLRQPAAELLCQLPGASPALLAARRARRAELSDPPG